MPSWYGRRSIGAAWGGYLQTVTLPASDVACAICSSVGCNCQKSAERQATAGPSEVPQPRRTRPAIHADPAVPWGGALVDLEAVGGQLPQAVFTPARDPVHPRRDPFIPGRGCGGLLTGDLGRTHLLPRVAA